MQPNRPRQRMRLGKLEPAHPVISRRRGSARELIEAGRWALDVMWRANRSLSGGLLALEAIRSLTPAALVLVSRELVNAVVEVIQGSASSNDRLIQLLAIGLLLTLALALAGFGRRYALSRLNDDINIQITLRILKHASRLDVPQFEDPKFQDIFERAQQNPAGHLSTFLTQVLAGLTTVIQAASLVAILVVIEPLVGLVLLPIVTPYLLIEWRLATGRYTKERTRTTKRRWSRYFVSRVTAQDLVPEVKILDLAPMLISKFRALMEEFREQDRRYDRLSLLGSSVFASLTTIAMYLLFARIALSALEGGFTVGDVAVFGGAMTRLRGLVEGGVSSLTSAFEHILYITNLRELFDIQPQIKPGTAVLRRPVRGEIEVEDLWFGYPGTRRAVIKGLNLSIAPGETVAIVGQNGAGKTTFVKLVARLYDPDRGSIQLDGVDVRTLAPEELHREVAFIFQHFGRYEATAGENIAYGDWRRLLEDRTQIEAIAQRADVHRIIEQLPDGYDTLLGRMFGEYTLSGGQWQRIALARAFAREAALLILDEPTSNLDARAEFRLFNRFRQLAKGRTTILISHRFSTVSMADRILVMDEGQIVESGSHAELLAARGHYATLFDLHHRRMFGAELAEEIE